MISKLKLKVIVHSGKTLFYKIGKFYELAGPDIIVAHRLLKNSLEEDEYILFTEAAYSDLEYSQEIDVIHSKEEYDDIGLINTKIYYPHGKGERHVHEEDKKKYSSIFSKMKNMLE